MKDLISKEYKHLLYKDECNLNFLLLRYGEIYRYSDTELGIYCWYYAVSKILRQKRLILSFVDTDDLFDVFFTKIENLDVSIAILRAPKTRINRISKKMQRLEKLLSHKIIPYNPKLEVIKENYRLPDQVGI